MGFKNYNNFTRWDDMFDSSSISWRVSNDPVTTRVSGSPWTIKHYFLVGRSLDNVPNRLFLHFLEAVTILGFEDAAPFAIESSRNLTPTVNASHYP